MDRKEFLRNTCKLGACACTGMLFMNRSSAATDTAATAECPPDKDAWKLDFVQKRFAKLVDIVDSNVDEAAKVEIIEQLGRSCAQIGNEQTKKYAGDIDGFLKYVQTQWVEKAEYDKKKNEITVFDKPQQACFCPFVNGEIMSEDFCNCSKGWQKQTYETILGKKVDVEILSSILRGGDRCSFKIKVLG